MLSEKDMEYVLMIATCQNITRAAERLYIAQPALSRHLRNLEQELGVQLFDRSVTPLALTKAGERYVNYAQHFQNLLLHMQEEFSIIAPQTQSTLSLGLPSQIATYIFPRVIPSFLERYPTILVDMKYGTTRYLSDLLRANRLHLSVLSSPLQHEEFQNDLIAYDKILMVLPRNSNATCHIRTLSDGTSVIPLHAVAGEHLFITEAFFASTASPLFEAAGIAPARITFVPNLTVAWEMACKGSGSALIMQSMCRDQDVDNTPLYCALDDPDATMHFTLTYRESIYQESEALMLFVQHCHSIFSAPFF